MLCTIGQRTTEYGANIFHNGMNMHVTIIATGSRGDTQPMVALGCGLKTATLSDDRLPIDAAPHD
jgi:hypothetical protein